jgi:hypothetical protein
VITIEQNTEGQLLRLAAQRQLYATAKTVFGWQVFLGGPVAVASAVFVLAYPSLKGFAASWGRLVTLADLFWLTPWQKRLRDSASKIQEAFDCDVLELPWNEVKAGKNPDPELIKEQSDKYSKWAGKMPLLTNWYAPAVNDLPLHIGRIACQRSNCWWDSIQRRRYANCVIAAAVLVFVVVLGLSLGAGFTVEDFVLKVAAPLAPALLLGMRQYSEQMEAAARLDRLREHSERLWKDALSGKSMTEVSKRARSLQDEILESRRKSPFVFDAIYKWLRPGYEAQMNFGVAELVAQAKQKLGLS